MGPPRCVTGRYDRVARVDRSDMPEALPREDVYPVLPPLAERLVAARRWLALRPDISNRQLAAIRHVRPATGDALRAEPFFQGSCPTC